MGFVEIYTIVLFSIGLVVASYYTGAGIDPAREYHPMGRFFCRWIATLPLMGRIFGWW